MSPADLPAPRRKSVPVMVGDVPIGGDRQIVVQSMTNTDTADVEGTVAQVAALARAGSEIVRITVDRAEAAAAVPRIREALDRQGVGVPLVGDFHYIGHKLLTEYPACAEALAKYRINPGNVGFRAKRDTQFATMIEVALEYDRPVRIGVNWGSLDQELLAGLMDENARRKEPKDAAGVTREALVASAIGSCRARPRARPRGRPDRAFLQGLRCAGPDRGLPRPRAAMRLCAPSRPHRGGDGKQGDRRVHGGARGAPAGRDRRYDTHLADARARRRPDARSHRCAGNPADHGAARLRAAGGGLPRLRADHQHGFPGACR